MFSDAKAIEGTTDARRPLRKVQVWKGDHRPCEVGHADGVCRALTGWRLNGDFQVVPVVVGRSIERRHYSTAEYSEESGKETEPAWQAKGFRVADEAKRAKPTAEIVAKLREVGADGLAREYQHLKASFADQQAAKKEFLEKFDAANGAPATKPPRGGSRG